MPTEPMSNAPFAVPPDSPFFPNVGGEACFKFENGKWSLCTFNSWPPEAQARCAAVAASEWAEVAKDSMGGTFAGALDSMDDAQDAYRAARERMKGGGQ